MSEKETLLAKYKKVWDKIDEIDKKANAILQTSGVGQASPCFHKAIDEQLSIIEKEATPIWNDLKHFLKSDKKTTYWQVTRWRVGSLVPHYSELGECLKWQ